MLPLQGGLNQHNCPEEQLAEEEADEEEECQGLATNPETRLQPATPEEEEVEERRTSEDGVAIQDSRIPRFEDEDCENEEETHFQEVEQHRATDFGPSATLGRSHSRSKTISRSIVPMMRKMFERAKSCDPDVISPHGDGTESSRSSFSQYQLTPSGLPHAHSVSPAPSSLTISECGSSPSMPRSRSKGAGSSGGGLITKIKAKFKSSS
jgi:hypothetical protein